MNSPSWHFRSYNDEKISICPETSVTGMDWDVFRATMVFIMDYVASVSIRKSIKSSLNVKVTGATYKEIGIRCLKSQGALGPHHSSLEWSFLYNIEEAPIFLLFSFLSL